MNQKPQSLQPVRVFSEAVKKRAVADIEKGKASVLAVSRELQVSQQSVYRWLNRYSRHLHSQRKIVIEMDSEAYKTKELEKRIKELEAALGRKQLEVDFLNKMIEIGKEQHGIDLKKKLSTPPSSGSKSKKGDNTAIS
jgi:transposase